jgi:hypothetical protein
MGSMEATMRWFILYGFVIGFLLTWLWIRLR